MTSKRPSTSQSLVDMWAAAASSKRPALENACESDCSTSSEDEGNPESQHELDTSDPV